MKMSVLGMIGLVFMPIMVTSVFEILATDVLGMKRLVSMLLQMVTSSVEIRPRKRVSWKFEICA